MGFTGLIILGALIGTMLIPRSPSGYAPAGASAGSVDGVAKLVNGVQEVTLSWGKLNYDPQVITVKNGVPVKITGDLNRLQGCFRTIDIPAFSVAKTLTSRDNTIQFTPNRAGRFIFQCGMGMGSGVLVVE